ncbi:hypothetical protein QVD17_20992 [Tagetes erecta]|uniref:Uncharacterized protein n=1 Tax=Tagetes erecta TaxID=13708 RepID=A0AAD8KSP3_TARER|nr:hypothetical protein QVD17_20992 [Tagetes erecta]
MQIYISIIFSSCICLNAFERFFLISKSDYRCLYVMRIPVYVFLQHACSFLASATKKTMMYSFSQFDGS